MPVSPFSEDPKTWIETEYAKISALPEWKALKHPDLVQCGRCGCDCGEMCPGIPLKGDIRYERIQKLDPKAVAEVPLGEGLLDPYGPPNGKRGMFIKLHVFCEGCFHHLCSLDQSRIHCVSDEEAFGPEHYKAVQAESLLDQIAEEIRSNPRKSNLPKYYGPCFFNPLGDTSWPKNHKVDVDDAAVVIAYGLIQPDCVYECLDLSAFRFNAAGFGERGFKALAYAFSINTTVQCLILEQNAGSFHGETHPTLDTSKGLMLKALQVNKASRLKYIEANYSDMGCKTLDALDKVMNGR